LNEGVKLVESKWGLERIGIVNDEYNKKEQKVDKNGQARK
jgi:hypothetical protein